MGVWTKKMTVCQKNWVWTEKIECVEHECECGVWSVECGLLTVTVLYLGNPRLPLLQIPCVFWHLLVASTRNWHSLPSFDTSPNKICSKGTAELYTWPTEWLASRWRRKVVISRIPHQLWTCTTMYAGKNLRAYFTAAILFWLAIDISDNSIMKKMINILPFIWGLVCPPLIPYGLQWTPVDFPSQISPKI